MSASRSLSRVTACLPDQLLEPRLQVAQKPDRGLSTGNWTVSVAASLPAVEKLRPIWEQWAHSPQTEFEYYLHRLRTDSTVLGPCVLTVCRDHVPEAVVVGQVIRQRLSSIISAVNIRGPEVTVLEVVNGGRMGKESDVIDGLLAAQLWQVAKGQRVDLLLFQRLPLESELYRALHRMGSRFAQHRVPSIFCYSVVQLTAPPGGRPPFLSGKNLRETRRKARIIERAFPGRVRRACYSGVAEVDHGMHEASSVVVTTWQHYLGQDFLSDEQTRDHLRFVAAQGSLRIYVMYIDDSPCAFLIGQLHKDKFYCLYAGYNPAFGKFSVGSLLTSWALTNLAATGVQEVDLGEGGQEHNRRLGCRSREEGTVHVYFPTPRGIVLNGFFALAQIVRAAGRRTITELRLSRLRKAWLQFLISRWRAKNGVGDLFPEERRGNQYEE
jgi:hypothetical protein